MSSTTPANPEVASSPARPRKKRPYIKIALLVLLLSAAVCLLTPSIFQRLIREALVVALRRHGIQATIDKVSGSVFEPVSFYGVHLAGISRARTASDITIRRADVEISLLNILLNRRSARLRSVTMDGVEGRVRIERGTGDVGPIPSIQSGSGTSWLQKWIPSSISATHVNLDLVRHDEYVEIENLRCLLSDRTPGTLEIDKVNVKQQWLTKTFTAVKCDTAFQNSRVSIANLVLEKNITITDASSDLLELAHSHLKIDFDVNAFGGYMRGEIRSASPSLDAPFEASGEFSKISIPGLAAFLKFTGESSGTINEGKFTFQGSWRDLEKATLSVRFDATDFQLGQRKWNSLVCGADLVENRLEIHDLSLKQAHNELKLKGRMALPQPDTEWWQSDFAFDLSAKIDNLTELSELFGPEFADMGGKVNIDGSIQGSNQSFNGQLAVAGSNLSYRTAPLDALHAEIKLNGNELQINNLDLSNKGDFVRGRGVVNILGAEKRYWGELKASVADLTRYSAILQKPIVPQPLAGGLVVDWSGDGVAKAHSGAFHAQLKKFRLVSVTEPKAHPLNADVEATYSPGNIFFSKLLVWDNNTNFTAKVTVAPKSLNLQSMRLQQGGDFWLEGDALLPFNVWSAWENASWGTLLVFDSPCKFNVTTKNLDLHETALLSGRELPIKGILDINLKGDGATLNDLQTNGRVQLKKSQLTLGEKEPDAVGGDADFVFNGQEMRIEKSQAFYNARVFSVLGKADLKNLHAPAFDLAVSTKDIPLTLRDDITAGTELDLTLRGTWDEMLVGGTAHLLDIKLPARPTAAALLAQLGDIKLAPALPFDATQPLFNKWQYDVALSTAQPVKAQWRQPGEPKQGAAPKYDASGTLAVNGSLLGKGAGVHFTGSTVFQNVTLTSVTGSFTINEGTLLFPKDESPAWISLAISGKAGGEDFAGSVSGPESATSLRLTTPSDLPQQAILDLIAPPSSDSKESPPADSKEK